MIRRLTVGRPPGPVLELLDLGARVHRLEVAGADGSRHDLVLTLPDPADHVGDPGYVGAVVGRCANRIAHGRFELDGVPLELPVNDGAHHLHGGPDGFDQRTWDVAELDPTRVRLRLVSPDGDQGYPGTLTAEALFEVRDDRVVVTLTATTDAPTIVNLAAHPYFDLGPDAELAIRAERFTPVDAAGIPTGEVVPVAGTPYDLRPPQPVGALDLDHNFVVDGDGLRTAAVLASERRGLRVEVRTDQPGLQAYTGHPRGGLALEAQRFPDAPHHPDFPSVVLRPGETYRSHVEWVVRAG